MKQSHKTLLLWGLLIVMFFAIWNILQPGDRKAPIAFSEFIEAVQKGQVKDIHIKEHDYTFTLHSTDGSSKAPSVREAVGPIPDEALLATLKPNADVKDATAPKIYFEKEDSSPFWSTTIVTLAPDDLHRRHVLPLHAPAPGRGRQGHELRQEQGADAERLAEQGHVRGRGGRRTRPRTRSKRSSRSSRTRRSSSGSAVASRRGCS